MAATNNASQDATFSNPSLLGFVASETERSKLLISLLGEMKTRQLRVAVISESTVDHKTGAAQPDFRAAGAERVLTVASVAGAFSTETRVHGALDRDHLRQQINPADIDLVLLDGFARPQAWWQ